MSTHTFLDLTNSSVLDDLHSKAESAYVQTTDATATTLWSLVVDEQTCVTVFALVSGLRDDHSEAITGMLIGGVRRDGGGNATTTGSPTVTSTEDSSGTPSFTLDADTGTQTARIRVTGEGSKNIDWTATVIYMVVTT